MTALPPLAPRPEVLDFLLTRRSRPAKTLGPAIPDDATIRMLLTAAARVPDHGKLEPWRFIVLRRAACLSLAETVRNRGQASGIAPETLAKSVAQFADAHLAIAVIASPKPSEKIPAVEQLLSAGAVCLGLVNAALATGWGANWLTGWMAHDAAFGAEALGLAAPETVAGFIHIGAETAAPPDRPRPDPDAITTWRDA